MERARILIVEDDPALAAAIDAELRRAYDTRVAHSGGDALDLALRERFDLVVLDLNLPDMDGIEVAERLQATPSRILMLTARADVRSRVKGLYAGASDYMAKPFEMQELVARVYAQLRRRGDADVHRWGPLEVSVPERRCRVEGVALPLSAAEFRLLALLVANQGRLFSKSTLEERLYEEAPVSNAIEALISRLRAKLAEVGVGEAIENVRGLGYVMREPRR